MVFWLSFSKWSCYARLFGFRCNVAASWFYLGWIGEPGKGRALGVNSVKFTGEVLKKVKMATMRLIWKEF